MWNDAFDVSGLFLPGAKWPVVALSTTATANTSRRLEATQPTTYRCDGREFAGKYACACAYSGTGSMRALPRSVAPLLASQHSAAEVWGVVLALAGGDMKCQQQQPTMRTRRGETNEPNRNKCKFILLEIYQSQ